jgi:predicted DNA-binding WGR domain protein
VRERWFATEAAARDAGRRLRAQKERRGYRARAG